MIDDALRAADAQAEADGVVLFPSCIRGFTPASAPTPPAASSPRPSGCRRRWRPVRRWRPPSAATATPTACACSAITCASTRPSLIGYPLGFREITVRRRLADESLAHPRPARDPRGVITAGHRRAQPPLGGGIRRPRYHHPAAAGTCHLAFLRRWHLPIVGRPAPLSVQW